MTMNPQLLLGEVTEGDRLPPLSYDVSATTVVLGALAARDWRPMHHDKDFAVEHNGTRDIFLNTPNQAAWFERYLTDWTGPHGRLGRMTFRMRGSVFPGDTMVFDGVVAAAGTDETGCGWIDVDVTVAVGGETKTSCQARVAVPVGSDDNPLGRAAATGGGRDRRARTEEERSVLNLTFTAEQEMLRDTVRRLCATSCPLSVVRELEDDPVGYDTELWKQLGALDLTGLLIPEEYGGSGMTALEGVVLYEELGRALVPTPHFVSAVLSAGALVRAGSDEQRDSWLARIGAGDAVLTPAWLEPESGFGPRGVQTRATPADGGFRISGTKRHVAFARAATRLVVLARTGDGDTDVDLFLVDPDAPGVTLTQQFSVASDTQYRVDLRDVAVAESDRIGAAGSGWDSWDAAMHDGIVLLAAQAMGGARQALELAVQYAKDREQFDKPLGAFQAIAHYLSDAITTVDGGDTLVHQAAWAQAEGRSTDRLAPMAKLFACRTYRDVTAMAQQVFGGIGFTLEFDIQLHFRRAKQLQLSWWDPRALEERVAAAVLD